MSFRETAPPRIEIFSRRGLWGRRYYFRVRATNGQPVAHSEGYRNREDCIRTASNLRHLADARLFDADTGQEIE